MPDENMVISELKVMKSAAGYYLGTSYTSDDMPWQAPYSRESGYWATEEEAKKALDSGIYSEK